MVSALLYLLWVLWIFAWQFSDAAVPCPSTHKFVHRYIPFSCPHPFPVLRLVQSLLSKPPSASAPNKTVLYLVHITGGNDSMSRANSMASPSGDSFGGRAREGEEGTLLDTFCLYGGGNILRFGGRGPSLPNIDVRRLTVPVNEGGLLETMQEHVSESALAGGGGEGGREGETGYVLSLAGRGAGGPEGGGRMWYGMMIYYIPMRRRGIDETAAVRAACEFAQVGTCVWALPWPLPLGSLGQLVYSSLSYLIGQGA